MEDNDKKLKQLIKVKTALEIGKDGLVSRKMVYLAEYYEQSISIMKQLLDEHFEVQRQKDLENLTKPTGTEADVITDIAKRQQIGLKKYHISVRDNPIDLRGWLQHQYEELLDAAIYCKRAIEELDKGKPCVANSGDSETIKP